MLTPDRAYFTFKMLEKVATTARWNRHGLGPPLFFPVAAFGGCLTNTALTMAHNGLCSKRIPTICCRRWSQSLSSGTCIDFLISQRRSSKIQAGGDLKNLPAHSNSTVSDGTIKIKAQKTATSISIQIIAGPGESGSPCINTIAKALTSLNRLSGQAPSATPGFECI